MFHLLRHGAMAFAAAMLGASIDGRGRAPVRPSKHRRQRDLQAPKLTQDRTLLRMAVIKGRVHMEERVKLQGGKGLRP